MADEPRVLAQLEFVGVLHWDPCGPELLEIALRDIESEQAARPHFVAAEWAQCSHRRVACRRPNLELTLLGALQGFHAEVIGALVRAMGYEADVHVAFWPDALAVWLDEGLLTHDIAVNDTALRAYDLRRALFYLSAVINSGVTATTPPADALARLRRHAWSITDDGQQVVEAREAAWYDRVVKARSGLRDGEYGVCIVGDGHLSDGGNFIYQRCKQAGFRCNKRTLRPNV